jgi:hypothetical protein
MTTPDNSGEFLGVGQIDGPEIRSQSLRRSL